jgi:predicted dehydrogenase
MQVGIVGAGTIFADHVNAYRALGVPVVAVADIDRGRAEEAAARFVVPHALGDWAELVNRDDIQIVDVCTPPETHSAVVLAALRTGKHVVCEKPLAPTLAELDEIVRAAGAAPGKLAVVHQLRFDPIYQRLKWCVDRGYLGKLCFVRQVLYDAPPPPLVEKGVWGQWRMAGGGVVMTKGVHLMDLLLWMMGDARRVQAMTGTYLYPIESEDHAVINIEFASGALGSVILSGHDYGHRQEMELVGDAGRAGLGDVRLKDAAAQQRLEAEMNALWPRPGRLQRKWMKFKRKWDALAVRFGAKKQPPPPNPHTAFLGSFLEAARGHSPVPATARDARKAVELCTAVYTAALTRTTIELPLDPSARFYGGVCKDDYAAAR